MLLVNKASFLSSLSSVHVNMKHTIKQVFEKYDVDKTGTVSKESLCKILKKLVPNLENDSLNGLVSLVDINDDGVISYHEFLDYIFSFRQPPSIQKLFDDVQMPNLDLPDDEFNKGIFAVLLAKDKKDTVGSLQGFCGNYHAALMLMGYHVVNEEWFQITKDELIRRYLLKDNAEDASECRMRDVIFLGFNQYYGKLWNAQFENDVFFCPKTIIRGTDIQMIVTPEAMLQVMYKLGVHAGLDSTVQSMRDAYVLPAYQRQRLLIGMIDRPVKDLFGSEVEHLDSAAKMMRRHHCFTSHEAACLLHNFRKVPNRVPVLEAVAKVTQWMGFKSSPEYLFNRFDQLCVPHSTDQRSDLRLDGGVVLGLFRMCFTFEEETVTEFLHSGGHCLSEDHDDISPFVLELLQNFGYSLTPDELSEILEQLEIVNKHKLTDAEFWRLLFMLGFRQGFDLAEIAVYCEAFDRFSRQSPGLMNRSELNRAVRYLGISPMPVEDTDVIRFTHMVDLDGSQNLDVLSFLRLIRLCRESICAKYERTFRSYSGNFDVGYPPKGVVLAEVWNLRQMLAALGFAAGEHDVMAALKTNAMFSKAHGNKFDYFTFLEFADAYRIGLAIKMRRQALFSDEEVAELRQLFEKFDEDHSGEITPSEQRRMLAELFPDALHDQAKHKQVERLMREVDVHQSEGQVGTNLDLEEFLWLCHHRIDIVSDDQKKKEVDAIMTCGYTTTEVEQFRDIFLQVRGANTRNSTIITIPQEDVVEILQRAVYLSDNNTNKIAKVLTDVHGTSATGFDFPDFLRVMREIQDMDAGEIVTNAALKEQLMHKLEDAIAVSQYTPDEITELRKIFESQGLSDEKGDSMMIAQLQTLWGDSVKLTDEAVAVLNKFLTEVDMEKNAKLDFPEFVLFMHRIQISSSPDVHSAQDWVHAALKHHRASYMEEEKDGIALPAVNPNVHVGRKGRKGRRAKAC